MLMRRPRSLRTIGICVVLSVAIVTGVATAFTPGGINDAWFRPLLLPAMFVMILVHGTHGGSSLLPALVELALVNGLLWSGVVCVTIAAVRGGRA